MGVVHSGGINSGVSRASRKVSGQIEELSYMLHFRGETVDACGLGKRGKSKPHITALTGR